MVHVEFLEIAFVGCTRNTLLVEKRLDTIRPVIFRVIDLVNSAAQIGIKIIGIALCQIVAIGRIKPLLNLTLDRGAQSMPKNQTPETLGQCHPSHVERIMIDPKGSFAHLDDAPASGTPITNSRITIDFTRGEIDRYSAAARQIFRNL